VFSVHSFAFRSQSVRLVRKYNGCHELIGGTAERHAALAREWCSLFAHAVAFNSARPWSLAVSSLTKTFSASSLKSETKTDSLKFRLDSNLRKRTF